MDAQTHKLPGHGSVNQEDFPIAAIYILWQVGVWEALWKGSVLRPGHTRTGLTA